MSGCDQSTVESLADDPTDSPFDADDCLKVRKYWCFLLSSIFTFLAGLLIVLLWRAFAFICCRKEPDLGPNDPKQKEQKASRNKQEFEGTFMTEAKDWAGELISGQTTTGRILVSTKYYSLYIPPSSLFLVKVSHAFFIALYDFRSLRSVWLLRVECNICHTFLLCHISWPVCCSCLLVACQQRKQPSNSTISMCRKCNHTLYTRM